MNARLLFYILISCLFVKKLYADQMVSCNDGDTCRIKVTDSKVEIVRKVRLSGIDAPEQGQTHWKESRDFLVNLLTGKELELQCNGTSFDRATCRIFIKSMEVNDEMVKNGMAWNYPQFSERRYYKSELEAREKKLGLWKLAPDSSPFCFRHIRSGSCRENKNLYQP